MSLYKIKFAILFIFIVIAMVSGCGDKDDPVSSDAGDNGSNPQDTITYTANTKAILDSKCISCHASSLQGSARNGAPSGGDFDTYTSATANSTRGNVRVQAGTMPPSGGIPQSERDIFQQWLDQGLLE